MSLWHADETETYLNCYRDGEEDKLLKNPRGAPPLMRAVALQIMITNTTA